MKTLNLALSAFLAGSLAGARPLAAQQATNGPSLVVAEMVEPLISKWKDAYVTRNPSNSFTYTTTLQDSVYKAFLSGDSLLAPSAREFTAEEVRTFTAKWGYPPTRVAICLDALVVLVNKTNPVKEIKIEQLDAIYSTTRLQGWPRDVKVWGDLGLTGSNWASRPIEVFGHPEGSGTRQYYLQVVQKGGTSKPTIRRGADIMEMIEYLTTNQAGIGYGSVSQAYSTIRTVPVVPVGGKTAVEPTPAAIVEGAYPLGRTLYIYANVGPGKPLDPTLLGFLRFALSREGQAMVPQAGFVPLSEDMAGLNLKRLGVVR